MVMQNLMANLGGLGLGGPKVAVPERVGFRTDVQIEDGDAGFATTADVVALINAIAAGVWATIWEMTIPAQQMVHWGYGSPATPQNQGYMWFGSSSGVGATWEVGVLRLVQQNARRTKKLVVAEIADRALHAVVAAANDGGGPLLNKNEMIALPEKVEFPLVGEDSIISLEYRPITVIVGVATSIGFKVPITVYQ